MKRNIFITGASSEIGISTCETFLNNKDTLIMNVRSKKNKNKLIKYFKNKYEYNREYFIYVFDIGDIDISNTMFRKIYKKYGIRGFYTGYGVNILKAVPETMIQFAVYDKVTSFLRTK